MSKLMLSILGGVAEFEGSIIRERQREGIAVGKRQDSPQLGRLAHPRGSRPEFLPILPFAVDFRDDVVEDHDEDLQRLQRMVYGHLQIFHQDL